VKRHLSLFLILAGLGCQPVHERFRDAEPIHPSKWILVDRPYSDLGDLAKSGVAEVKGASRAWILEPVFEPKPAAFPHGLRLVYSRPRRHEVDEIVEVDVAIEDCDLSDHVIEILPTRRGVELLTPERMEVGPGGRATVRFRAGSTGMGGVAIRVLVCGKSEWHDIK
jgi:hypothetical protein